MKNICLIYQYDGSKFFGNQKQKNLNTVSGLIEKVLLDIFNEKIHLINCGRTDKGVHAKMQLSNFFIEKNISLEAIKFQIEKCSKGNIKILKIYETNKEFNSRYDIVSRTYEYILSNEINPFNNEYITYIDYEIDIDKMNNILKEFIGKYNFLYFSKKEKKGIQKNFNREIYDSYAVKDGKKIKIYIEGNAFLKTQIRIMIGTVLKIYEGKLDINFIKRALNGLENESKKYIASSNGLYLYKVEIKK